MVTTLVIIVVGVFGLVRWQHPLKYRRTLVAEAKANRLDPRTLAAIIFTESKFEPGSRSEAGAIGLMQLMPETATWAASEMGRRISAKRLTEPAANIAIGAWYYRYLLDKYGDERLALAAYNGGEHNLDKWLAVEPGAPIDEVIEAIPFEETRVFVGRVRETKIIYDFLYPGLRGDVSQKTRK